MLQRCGVVLVVWARCAYQPKFFWGILGANVGDFAKYPKTARSPKTSPIGVPAGARADPECLAERVQQFSSDESYKFHSSRAEADGLSAAHVRKRLGEIPPNTPARSGWPAGRGSLWTCFHGAEALIVPAG